MIEYVDRKTGIVTQEKVYGSRSLSFLYGGTWLSRLIVTIISKVPLFSKVYGLLQKMPWSKRKVAPFITTYGIDPSEFEKTTFTSFNDFFIRKLKGEKRPFETDPKKAILPADGRYLVFPDLSKVEQFYVKGQKFDLKTFLQNEAYGRRFSDGAMMIARLCPVDYHRFHFIADGVPQNSVPVKGDFYSVNPIALRKSLSILWQNKRMITDFDTQEFGKVLYIEVGATCVGTIHQTFHPEEKVKKGDEKGYFSFGGSCIVMLFEKERISFDEDLIKNSERGLETKANFGQTFGSTM